MKQQKNFYFFETTFIFFIGATGANNFDVKFYEKNKTEMKLWNEEQTWNFWNENEEIIKIV